MSLLYRALLETYASLVHYLPFLAIGTLIAAAVRVYLDQRSLAQTLARYAKTSIFLVTLFATLTPFCSCGTIAVALSMIASTVPWGPIVAFMVSSPLMSPSEYIYTAGVMGWGFATALLAASIALGVGAGYLADALERRGLLKNQARLEGVAAEAAEGTAAGAGGYGCCSVGCGDNEKWEGFGAGSPEPACGCGSRIEAASVTKAGSRPESRLAEIARRMKLRELAAAGLPLGLRILGFFVAFSYIGHLLTLAFPSRWMLGLFGQGRFHAVPLAAALGVPLYINAEVSMPVIKSFVEMGMSPGAALALTITGAGTCVGAITGAFVIAKKRIVGLVVGSLWLGAVLAGYVYDLVLAMA